jgi:hypothetical protein
MSIILRRKFKEDTGYAIDETHPKTTTYWHFYEEVREEEYYRNYTEWLENNCAILLEEDSEYIYSFMPDWVKEQPEGLNPQFYGTFSAGGDEQVMLKIKSILKL